MSFHRDTKSWRQQCAAEGLAAVAGMLAARSAILALFFWWPGHNSRREHERLRLRLCSARGFGPGRLVSWHRPFLKGARLTGISKNPNFTVPSPNFTVPSLNFTVPSPNFTVPSPNFTEAFGHACPSGTRKRPPNPAESVIFAYLELKLLTSLQIHTKLLAYLEKNLGWQGCRASAYRFRANIDAVLGFQNDFMNKNTQETSCATLGKFCKMKCRPWA